MCGIAGIIGPISEKDKHDIKLFKESISKRGPDNAREIVKDNIAIANSVLSMSEGLCPMENDRYVFAINGEIYNHQHLRQGLKYDFKTKNDCEVLLAGITLKGLDFVYEVNGDFAFVLYDKKKRKYHLFVDRQTNTHTH